MFRQRSPQRLGVLDKEHGEGTGRVSENQSQTHVEEARKTLPHQTAKIQACRACNALRLLERLEEADVSELVIGDVTGIRKNAHYSRKVNQEIRNFWSFASTTQRIR